VLQLEGVVDPPLALVRECRQQGDERQDEQDRVRVSVRRDDDAERDRRECGVDHVRPAHEPELRPQRQPERQALPGPAACDVERELGREGSDVDGPLVPRRPALCRKPENQRRPDRVPGVDEQEEDAVGRKLPREEPGAAAEAEAERDEQRHRPGRDEKQHRDEDQLGRQDRAGSDLELDARGDRVGEDEGGDRDRARRAVRRDQRGHRRGRGDEPDGERQRGGEVALAQPPERAEA